jgi:TetR/AcrR family tetracycline transcriptional repressor
VPERSPVSSTGGALSPGRILDMAIAIADSGGPGALSMRGLARELGVTPMALYWHFADKDALLDAMLERLVAGAELVQPAEAAAPDARFRAVVMSLLTMLRAHAWAGPLVVERLVPQPNYLRALETMLDCLRQLGLDSRDAALVSQQAVQSAVALVEFQPRSRHGKDRSHVVAAAAEFVAGLPDAAFPRVREAAEDLHTTPDLGRYYELGVDAIVGGITAVSARVARS